jgi:hypothetical protein
MMAAKTVKKELLNDDIKVKERINDLCKSFFCIIHSMKENIPSSNSNVEIRYD